MARFHKQIYPRNESPIEGPRHRASVQPPRADVRSPVTLLRLFSGEGCSAFKLYRSNGISAAPKAGPVPKVLQSAVPVCDVSRLPKPDSENCRLSTSSLFVALFAHDRETVLSASGTEPDYSGRHVALESPAAPVCGFGERPSPTTQEVGEKSAEPARGDTNRRSDEEADEGKDTVPARKRSGRKKTYTTEEERLLVQLVQKYGEGNWAAIAQHMPGKNRKQLRERYMYFLKKDAREESFTAEDDRYIMETIRVEGRVWSKMAIALPGKNSLMIKNHYYSKLRKEIKKAATAAKSCEPKRKHLATGRVEVLTENCS